MIDQSDAIRKFKDAMQSAGLVLSYKFEADGNIHYCDVADKGSAGIGDGRYLLHLHRNYAAGGFIDWTSGHGWQKWNYKRPGWQPTPQERREIEEEMQRARTEAERERRKARIEARHKANRMWERAETAPSSHPYLMRKQVKPYGLRAMRFNKTASWPLLVPMYNSETDRLVNLQFIDDSGYKPGRRDGSSKRFLTGGLVGGCYYWIAGRPKDPATIYLCEGYATGATIREVTNGAVVMAFNTNNLRSIAQWLRQRYPKAKIVVCSDDDWKTTGNPGLTAARDAASAVNGVVAVPKFDETREDTDTDFNDMANGLTAAWSSSDAGPHAVKQVLEAAVAPPATDVEEDADQEDAEDEADEGDDATEEANRSASRTSVVVGRRSIS